MSSQVNTRYIVWEPAIESIESATKVDAQTPGQAAFFVANERKIGHRCAVYSVASTGQQFAVEVYPVTCYQVGEVRELQTDAPA